MVPVCLVDSCMKRTVETWSLEVTAGLWTSLPKHGPDELQRKPCITSRNLVKESSSNVHVKAVHVRDIRVLHFVVRIETFAIELQEYRLVGWQMVRLLVCSDDLGEERVLDSCQSEAGMSEDFLRDDSPALPSA